MAKCDLIPKLPNITKCGQIFLGLLLHINSVLVSSS